MNNSDDKIILKCFFRFWKVKIVFKWRLWLKKSKEGQDQESIQSSTTPDRRHHIETDKITKQHTKVGQDRSALSAGDHKAARNRQDSTTKTNLKHE